jgi:hypothetical protein
MLSMDDLLKGRQFDREIIILCVRWYLRFKLSFRDLVEMMAERGISLAHTTIMRWIARVFPAGVQEPGPAATKDHARRCEDAMGRPASVAFSAPVTNRWSAPCQSQTIAAGPSRHLNKTAR